MAEADRACLAIAQVSVTGGAQPFGQGDRPRIASIDIADQIAQARCAQRMGASGLRGLERDAGAFGIST